MVIILVVYKICIRCKIASDNELNVLILQFIKKMFFRPFLHFVSMGGEKAFGICKINCSVDEYVWNRS